ncbi:hypothetical protein CIG11343_0415 [Campylobacter iguaniorum]|uniref:hypothetical protein n=1 Tax=Campylobacter iguaniorum TaxID=1244531 RepID=UPI0007C8A42D|nr:hypothetical protein [Campylobacter iguaniorum]ANE35497.1 hypothetical protein CIG11343_0415 [Campylobacter iguaniorum]
MNEKMVVGIIIAIIIAIILIIVLVINVVIKNRSVKQTPLATKSTPKIDDSSLSIQDLISIVSDQSTSRDTLFKACQYFLKNFKFPDKKSGTSQETFLYLHFIGLISSHKKSDAKLISYLDNEVKKSNPNYGLEVDKYEASGIAKRRFRS